MNFKRFLVSAICFILCGVMIISAAPVRVFTLSQVKYCADRIKWLYDNRELIGGLKWVEEPKVLRFFFGRLGEIGYWQEELAKKFREDFGDSL